MMDRAALNQLSKDELIALLLATQLGPLKFPKETARSDG